MDNSAQRDSDCSVNNPIQPASSDIRTRRNSNLFVQKESDGDPLETFEACTAATVDRWMFDNSISDRDTEEFNFGEMHVFGENDGLVCYAVRFTDNDSPDKAPERRTVYFLQDWTMLWDALLSRKKNYMGAYITLLYASQEFWFSRKVLSVIILLALWKILIGVITKVIDPASSLLGLYSDLALLCLLTLGANKIRGQWGAPTPRMAQNHFDDGNKNAVEFGIRKKVNNSVARKSVTEESRQSMWQPNISQAAVGAVNFTDATRVLFDNIMRPSIWYWKNEGSSSLRLKQYTKLLEMATSYLHFFGGESKFKPNPITVFLTLLFFSITIVYATYVLIHSWADISPSICTDSSPVAKAECIYFIMTFAYVLSTIYTIGIHLALITMFATILYGCDVACALTNNWLNRYEGLRRVPLAEVTDAKNDKDVSSDVAGTDQKKSSGIDKEAPEVEQAIPPPDPELLNSQITLQHMSAILDRDAVERYLFLHQVLDRSSQIWGPVLAGLLIVSAGIIVYAYIDFMYYFTVDNVIDGFSITVMAISVCMIIFVLGGMMLANSANDRIISGFTYSGMNDFAIIGGRESWIGFVQQSPVYWYIFGFAITRQWFFGFIGGTAVTIGGSLAFAFIGIEG